MSDIEELASAVRDINKNHPLPRCVHGSALEDPCGCAALARVQEEK